MKIFISHQKADTSLAGHISSYLRAKHNLDSYLDVIDAYASQAGEELGEYIRHQLGDCTHLLAVVSTNTKTSWWVPWEIGIATEKEQPIATFAGDNTTLPEYLLKWPYLKNQPDIDKYASALSAAGDTFRLRKAYVTEAVAQRSSTQEFYKVLRAKLGQ